MKSNSPYITQIVELIGAKEGEGKLTLESVLRKEWQKCPSDLIKIKRTLEEYSPDLDNLNNEERRNLASKMIRVVRSPKYAKDISSSIELRCFSAGVDNHPIFQSQVMKAERDYNGGFSALENNDGPADEMYY